MGEDNRRHETANTGGSNRIINARLYDHDDDTDAPPVLALLIEGERLCARY